MGLAEAIAPPLLALPNGWAGSAFVTPVVLGGVPSSSPRQGRARLRGARPREGCDMTSTGRTGGSGAGGPAVRPVWRSRGTQIVAAWASLLVAASLLVIAMSSPAPSPLSTTCTFTTSGTTRTLVADCTTDATISIDDGYTLADARHP